MNYKNILNNLTKSAELVKSWEKQGFVPSIEKDIVLGTIRSIYTELGPSSTAIMDDYPVPAAEAPAEEKAVTAESAPADNSSEDNIGQMTAMIEQMKSMQSGFMAEAQKQMEEMKESMSSFRSGLMEETSRQIAGMKDTISALEAKAAKELKMPEPAPQQPVVEAVPQPEPKPARPAAPAEPPVLGFYSLPESLRMDAIHNLFGGDVAKAEMAVNKMCSFRTIDELLIYIEEHYHWDIANITATTLIQKISKKF